VISVVLLLVSEVGADCGYEDSRRDHDEM